MTAATGASPRVALVETSDLLPGLLPFQAWDVLGTADEVLLRDARRHPAAAHLHLAGLDLVTVQPATLERADLDLSRPGSPEDRRLAKALLTRARSGSDVVYLLGPDDEGLAPALAGMAAEHDLEIELVLLAQQPEGTEVIRLVDTMRRLRDPDDGCPWDLKQDHASLTRYLVEETFELVDAIERGDDGDLVEELGDVLLQVVFHARIGADRRAFGIDEVARGISDKLVRRHPHVFGDTTVTSAEEVQANWDALKAREKAREGPFDGVPAAGPGLDLLHTLQRKSAKAGFDPAATEDPYREVVARLETLAADGAVGDAERLGRLGAVLDAVVALARHLDLDPEAAARQTAREVRARFEALLADLHAEGLVPERLDRQGWQERWRQAGMPPREG